MMAWIPKTVCRPEQAPELCVHVTAVSHLICLSAHYLGAKEGAHISKPQPAALRW